MRTHNRHNAKTALLWSLALWIGLAAGAQAGGFQMLDNVTYVERDGERVLADVYLPEGPGPFPGVLAVHGGAWMMGNKRQMSVYAEKLAAAGYTTVAINYRLAPKHPFPAQIEDCKAAVRWMRDNAQRYKIEPSEIGGLGYSAGGHLVALLGTTDPSCGLEGCQGPSTSTRLQCVVAGGAPCDFRALPANSRRLAYWLGGSRSEKPSAYELASPAGFLTKDDPPMLFFHGEADALVPIASPQAMHEKMKELGVPARFSSLSAMGHIEAFHAPRAEAEAIEFFDAHLKHPSAKAAAPQ